jgi:integrase
VLDAKTPRLAVMVTPRGAKSYYFVKKARGRFERVRIASVAELSVEKARKRVAILGGDVADGRSPTEDRRAVRAEMTLGQLWEAFKKRHGPKKRSLPTDERRYKRHLEAWASRKLSSIDRTAVIRLLDSITAASGPGGSNRVRALLHTLFEKAREWGAEIVNPVAGTPRNREHTKERYLSTEELGRFLKAVEADHDDDTRDFLRLLLFTGVRRGSLCAARWEDFALKDALWRIPGEYMKAGRPLEVPLAAAAVAILAEREKRAVPGAAWVFPGRSEAGYTTGPGAGWVRVLKRAQITGLTQHDLRRSFATYALEADVPLVAIAKVLGHTPVGGVTAVYARPTPSQVRSAVERTVDYILAVAHGGAQVITFPGAAVQGKKPRGTAR